jgi:DnaJ-domain-containing protein 1
VHHERLISGVAAALGLSAAAVTVLAFVFEVYALIILSLMLGAAAGFMWYQASGRLAAKIYRSVEQQGRQNSGGRRRRTRTRTRETGGFGAGPREDWTPPGGRGGNGQRARTNGGPGGRGGARQQRRTAPSTSPTMGRKEAFRTLGLSVDADEDAVKRAYREKVKEVHPDTDGGDEEAFKKVNRAYERLT